MKLHHILIAVGLAMVLSSSVASAAPTNSCVPEDDIDTLLESVGLRLSPAPIDITRELEKKWLLRR